MSRNASSSEVSRGRNAAIRAGPAASEQRERLRRIDEVGLQARDALPVAAIFSDARRATRLFAKDVERSFAPLEVWPALRCAVLG